MTIFISTNGLICINIILNYFEATDFDGTFELWCIILSIILIFNIFYSPNYNKNFIFSLDNLAKPEQALQRIIFFLQLIDMRHEHKEFDLLLRGFIFKHEEDCEIKECPLKIYKQKYLDMNEKSKMDEDKLLMNYCHRLYEVSVAK
jgi:hypothetical protein